MKLIGHIFFALFFFTAGAYFHGSACKVLNHVAKAAK